MNYTDKEKKGIDKVENMNKFFDKVLMPTIGVLAIITLIAFITGKLMDKFGGGQPSGSSETLQNSSADSDLMSLRAELLAGYEDNSEAFAAYGYEPAEGYVQDLALCKYVDEELVIYQFKDSVLGEFTILKYEPSQTSSGDAPYNVLSLTVSSEKLMTVTVSGDDLDCSVAFTSTDFSTYMEDDREEYEKMMKAVSLDELKSLYDIFEADINNLARSCGVS